MSGCCRISRFGESRSCTVVPVALLRAVRVMLVAFYEVEASVKERASWKVGPTGNCGVWGVLSGQRLVFALRKYLAGQGSKGAQRDEGRGYATTLNDMAFSQDKEPFTPVEFRWWPRPEKPSW